MHFKASWFSEEDEKCVEFFMLTFQFNRFSISLVSVNYIYLALCSHCIRKDQLFYATFPLGLAPKTNVVVAIFQIQWIEEFIVLPQPFPYFERKFK